jgi:hypothetical protein
VCWYLGPVAEVSLCLPQFPKLGCLAFSRKSTEATAAMPVGIGRYREYILAVYKEKSIFLLPREPPHLHVLRRFQLTVWEFVADM